MGRPRVGFLPFLRSWQNRYAHRQACHKHSMMPRSPTAPARHLCHGLAPLPRIGSFATDWQQAPYFVNRAIDADPVPRDEMIGPSTPAFVAIIEEAAQVRPNEIAVSGTRIPTRIAQSHC